MGYAVQRGDANHAGIETIMTESDLVEKLASEICPYGWRDDFWKAPGRIEQYDRNQQHVKETARVQARSALSLLKRLGMLNATTPQ